MLPLVVATTNAGSPLTADGVDLVDEDDAGGLLLGLSKQITDPTGTNTDEQLDEFGGRHRKKWHSRFAGNGTGQQRFSRAWGAHQQDATGNLGSKSGECFRLLEKGDHLLKLLLGVVDAGDVLEANLKVLLGLQPWLTATEPKGTVGHLGGSSQQEGEAHHQQQHQSEIAQQASHGLLAANVPHRQRRGGCFGSPQDLLIVNENADG